MSLFPRLALVFLLIGITRADSETQTDWSGGPYPGSRTYWNDQYHSETGMDWQGLPGYLRLQPLYERTITDNYIVPRAIASVDLDQDGDMDILSISNVNDLSGWENLDGLGTQWYKHLIYPMPYGWDVRAVDMDLDGDPDVLASGMPNILWLENPDEAGAEWILHPVSDQGEGYRSVVAVDLDGDDDLDVAFADGWAGQYGWCENVDGAGTVWTLTVFAYQYWYATDICAADLDEDGDPDLATAAATKGVHWWENTLDRDGEWIEHVLDDDINGGNSIRAVDLDADGHLDILVAADQSADVIRWWQNADPEPGMFHEGIDLVQDCNGAGSVQAVDLDDDGDLDLLALATNDEEVSWWENTNPAGGAPEWAKHFVDPSFDSPYSVCAADLNGDGVQDFIASSFTNDRIHWWDGALENTSGELLSTVLFLSCDPEGGYLDWNAVTPSGTSISFAVRAADYPGYTGEWLDTLTVPGPLDGVLTGGVSYFQYKVILQTETDPWTTPVLEDVTLTWNPVGIGEGPGAEGLALLGADPNPAGEVAVIRYAAPGFSTVEISVYDLSGRRVAVSLQESPMEGAGQVLVNGLPSGVYVCRMISGAFSDSGSFVVIR